MYRGPHHKMGPKARFSLKLVYKTQQNECMRISQQLTATQVMNELEKRLDRARKIQSSLAAKIIIINHFILASIWYILSLWVGVGMILNNLML